MRKIYVVEYFYDGKWFIWSYYKSQAHAKEAIRYARARYLTRLHTYTHTKTEKYERN